VFPLCYGIGQCSSIEVLASAADWPIRGDGSAGYDEQVANGDYGKVRRGSAGYG
jgi:hypothetical protein